MSMKTLFEEVFRPEDVMVKRYGSVLSPTASVKAIDSMDLRRNELDHWDRDYKLWSERARRSQEWRLVPLIEGGTSRMLAGKRLERVEYPCCQS